VTALAVALAGALGAAARYLLDRTVRHHLGHDQPWGTFVVNISGSLALGVVVGALAEGTVRTVVGTGFLGAYTTFSAFAFETVTLSQREGTKATSYAISSLIVGVVAAAAGLWLGQRV
jgi:fluoride exporter